MSSTGSDDTTELLETTATDDTEIFEGHNGQYTFALKKDEVDAYKVTFPRYRMEVVIDINSGATLQAYECERGKICKGMSATEVEQTLGAPDGTGRDMSKLSERYTKWTWSGLSGFCSENEYDFQSCSMTFEPIVIEGERHLILIEGKDMNPEYIDLDRF
jgi:hypothetical protein